MDDNESLEHACLRCAQKEIVEAAVELARQLKVDLQEDKIVLAVGKEVHKMAWDRRTIHYFAVSSNRTSILAEPGAQPRIMADAKVWRTYVWVPFAELGSNKIAPMDIAACELARGSGS